MIIFVLINLLCAWIPTVTSQSEAMPLGCKDLGRIENGWHNTLSSSDTAGRETDMWLLGSQVTYHCHQGFRLNGFATHVCLKTGWESGIKPVCERAVSCEEIDIEHGIVMTPTSDENLTGNRLTVTCNDGYRLMLGDNIYKYTSIVCNEYGKWDNYDGTGILPTCKAIVCGEPPVIGFASSRIVDPHGRSASLHMEGARAYYYCDEGYKLKEETVNVLKCDNGEWIYMRPKCLKKLITDSCIQPGFIENGYFSVYGGNLERTMADKTELYYMCEMGYKLVGQSIRKCMDGEWTGEVPRCEKTSAQGCHQPQNILHGDYEFLGGNKDQASDRMEEGSQVFYYCHSGYRLAEENSSTKMTCRDGQWQGNLPQCVKRTNCDTPQEIENGNWVILGFHESYSKYGIGTKILYECEDEYQAFGPTMIECQETGYWSDYPPKCLPQTLYCQEPGEVENGDYVCNPSPTHCDMFKVGMKITYSCNHGHKPSGQLHQECLTGGKWSALKPLCKSVSSTVDSQSLIPVSSNTLTIVVATSCSVLGLLLLVMVVVVLQRRKPSPRLCHPVPLPPPPYARPPPENSEEHDRMALIAFADGVQVVLPTYEEATRGPSHRSNLPRFPDAPGRRPGDYRPLPTVPSILRSSRHDSSAHPTRLDNHRGSIITTASTTTRDNISLAFGSIDTMNVSDGTSTTVTIETYDSAASNPSIATSQRATAGSLGSANSTGSIATEEAPLIDQRSNSDNDNHHSSEYEPAQSLEDSKIE